MSFCYILYPVLFVFVSHLVGVKTNKRNMEEMNTPHSMGSGQQHQHPMNHTRPFFYVQPPSQPYFLYQWHINNSYSHYGFPGSGLPYGRPYLPPYPYMQYPGYVVPQAPMQPMDYRRMFTPHFPSTGTSDLRYRCHQTRMRRETACSEVQTEPSDAVEKLMKHFGKMETCDPGNEKELDSGMVSQSSGTCLQPDEQKQFSLYGQTGLPQRSVPSREKSGEKPPSHKLFNESTSAKSRQDRLDDLAHHEEWSVSSCEGVLPLDSSSVHEDNVLQNVYSEEHEEQCVPTFPDKNCLSKVQADNGSIRSNWENTFAHDGKSRLEKVTGKGHLQGVEQNCEIASKPTSDSLWTVEPLTPYLPSASCLVYEGVEEDGRSGFKKPIPLLESPEKKSGDNEITEKHLPSSEDLKFRIMKLPFYTQEELQKDNPLWSVDSLNTRIPPASWLSTFGSAYYSYYPQAAQERQSVLSASLDELSSRDEIFSTDMEDIDIMPSHVYKGERVDDATNKMQEHADSDDYHNCSLNEEECPICPKKKTCATCGSCLSKVAVPNLDDDDDDDEEEVIEDEDASEKLKSHKPLKAASLKKTPPPKRPSQPCTAAVQFPKQKSKKGSCEEAEGSTCHEEQGLSCPDVDEEHKTISKAEKFKGQEQRNVPQKQMERLCHEGTATTSDQESWESYGARPRNKPLKPYPQPRGRGQERPQRKRPSCKTVVYQRSRRNEYDENEEGEFPRNQRGRGCGKRRGTRS
uniref:Bucky ball n=1 Tax=Acipenser dabryanus TaxID=62061 RepID=A0A2R2V0G8_ACIDA|nr:bucky ball [Acipenser dabryanus]